MISRNPAFNLDKVAATACQSLMFQQGGRCFQAKHYLQAAEWFKLSADSVFEATSEANLSKCLRKTALCYIQAGKYALATDTIAKCPGSEAATRYVSFLCAAYQGLEDDGTCPASISILLRIHLIKHRQQFERLRTWSPPPTSIARCYY